MYEHKYSYNYNFPEKSNHAIHLLQPDHIAIPLNDTYDIIKIIHNKYTIDIWESLEIYKQKSQCNLINDQKLNYNNLLFSN